MDTSDSHEAQPVRTPRHRSTGAYTAVAGALIYTPKTGTPTTTPWTTSVGSVKWMDDYKVENFYKRRAAGEIFQNPMIWVEDQLFSADIGAKFKSKSPAPYAYWDYTQNWGAPVVGRGSFLLSINDSFGDIVLEAQTRARANVRPPEFEGATALGELRENLRYMRNPFKEGLRLANQFQKKKIKHLRKIENRLIEAGVRRPSVTSEEILIRKLKEMDLNGIANSLSNLYLETRLGLIPLVGDLSNFATAINSYSSYPDRQTFRAKQDYYTQMTRNYSSVNANLTYNFSEIETLKVTVNAGVLCEYLTKFVSIRQKYGVEIHDIPAALWETIPLSFLVDNFVNIGTFIKAMRPEPTVRQLSSFTTLRVDRGLTRTWQSISDTINDVIRQPSGSWGKAQVMKSRSPGLGMMPVVTFRRGSISRYFEDPFKVLDLISLIKQRLI